MTHLVPVLRPVLGSPFRRASLYRAAGEIPSWHIAPVRTGTVTDLISGSQIITFTNSSPAWGFNSSGVLVQPTSNVPFIEYDPATGACLGWRVWDGVTNLLVRSEEFDNASWLKTRATVTTNAEQSPSGATTADRLIASTDANTHSALQSYTFSAGSHTFSIFCKDAGYPRVRLLIFDGTTSFAVIFDIATATSISTLGPVTSFAVTRAGQGYVRCSITVTAAAGAGNVSVRPVNSAGTDNFAGDGTSGIAIWGAQLNTGPLAPYVPTGALTASSTADVASITGAAFAGIWNQAGTTVYSDIKRLSAVPSGFPRAWQASDGTSVNRIEQTYYSGGQVCSIAASGVNQAEWYPAYFAENGVKAALAFATNDVAGASNGVITGTDNLATIPAVDRIFIGSENGSANSLRGYIREMAINKSRRPNANLQAMTP